MNKIAGKIPCALPALFCLTLNKKRNLAYNLRFCGQYEDEESDLFYKRIVNGI